LLVLAAILLISGMLLHSDLAPSPTVQSAGFVAFVVGLGAFATTATLGLAVIAAGWRRERRVRWRAFFIVLYSIFAVTVGVVMLLNP
jgi:hypothetical protein